MLKMTGRVTWHCAALLLALTSVLAVQRLNSISDLKKINFGHSVPTHILVLLYWFTEAVNIDNYNRISRTFDPDNGDYTSHEYHNYEHMLDPLPRGQDYYIIGNLHKDTSLPLPNYVMNTPYLPETENRDRIIIRVNGQRIDQVYITQHYEHEGTNYDPDHTYHITANLLREIRQFSAAENNQDLQALSNRFGGNTDVSDIRDRWRELAGLGLFLFIVTQTMYYYQSRRPENQQTNETSVTIPSDRDYTPVRQHGDCLPGCIALVIVISVVIFILVYTGVIRL